jgi:hypothetical protein
LIGAAVASTIFGLMWLFFRVWADLTLKDLTRQHIGSIAWVKNNPNIDLIYAGVIMFFAYVFGMGNDKFSSEDKEKLKPLVGEIQRINELLEPYFQLRKLAGFCFWASTMLFFGGVVSATLLITIPFG